jgi:hypothetical protein
VRPRAEFRRFLSQLGYIQLVPVSHAAATLRGKAISVDGLPPQKLRGAANNPASIH